MRCFGTHDELVAADPLYGDLLHGQPMRSVAAWPRWSDGHRPLGVRLRGSLPNSFDVETIYQTTSAMEQFKPEPMPISATRVPLCSRPISLSLDSVTGTDAGPMLPCSWKIVSTLSG